MANNSYQHCSSLLIGDSYYSLIMQLCKELQLTSNWQLYYKKALDLLFLSHEPTTNITKIPKVHCTGGKILFIVRHCSKKLIHQFALWVIHAHPNIILEIKSRRQDYPFSQPDLIVKLVSSSDFLRSIVPNNEEEGPFTHILCASFVETAPNSIHSLLLHPHTTLLPSLPVPMTFEWKKNLTADTELFYEYNQLKNKLKEDNFKRRLVLFCIRNQAAHDNPLKIFFSHHYDIMRMIAMFL